MKLVTHAQLEIGKTYLGSRYGSEDRLVTVEKPLLEDYFYEYVQARNYYGEVERVERVLPKYSSLYYELDDEENGLVYLGSIMTYVNYGDLEIGQVYLQCWAFNITEEGFFTPRGLCSDNLIVITGKNDISSFDDFEEHPFRFSGRALTTGTMIIQFSTSSHYYKLTDEELSLLLM